MLSLQTLARNFVLATLVLATHFTSAADLVAVASPPAIQGEAQAVALDKSGARFVVGRFSGMQDFNPFVGEDSKTSGGSFDAFVTRFNADGTYAWTKTFGGTMLDFARAVVVSGNTVYVGGTFASTSAGVGGSGSFACKGLRDVFVWALDAKTGESVATFGTGGIQTFGGAGTDNLQTMGFAGKNLIVAGNFGSTDATVGGVGTITALHAQDCYVLMLDPTTGKAVTSFGGDGAVVFGGSNTDEVTAVLAAGSTLFVAGSFKSMDFTFETTPLFGALGVRTAFVMALNLKDGTLNTKFNPGVGAIRFGGGVDDHGSRLAISGSTLFLGGELRSPNAGFNALGTISTKGMYDAYVVAMSAKDGALNTKFGNNGVFLFGGAADELLGGMVVSRNLYISGSYESINISLGAGLVAGQAGKKDVFVVALSPKTGTMLTKGGFGFSQFGGAENEVCNDMAAGKKALFVAGTFDSGNAGYGGAGGFSASNFFGLLAPFDYKTGGLPVK